ncbi:MAG: hypothetical protein QOI22_579 [Verrucomicrobiota bacterium]
MLLCHRPTADQVGAIDLNRPRRGRKGFPGVSAGAAEAFLRRRVNRPYLVLSILLLSILSIPALAKDRKQRAPAPSPSETPGGGQSLTNIPLTTGHEAKGLVLPDFDLDGRLRGRFEASSARRIDDDHIGFHGLKIITYTPEKTPDLVIEISDSVLDLKTRILSSKQRTTIKRADFNIAGDSVEFDTNTRAGKLMGNVKMVITGLNPAGGKQSE